MGLAQTNERRYSVEEYFRLEAEAKTRHEYRNGEIIAMAGGSYVHSLIIANVVGELRQRLKGTPCRVLESNLRVRLGRSARYSYPDATVICGKPQFDPQDPGGETVTNPRLVIEVLSPGTETEDRGEKFDRYREIASLEEYVIVSQASARVETYLRRDDGSWSFIPYTGIESIARLRSISVDLPLAEVYAGVTFESPAAEA